MRKFLVKTKTRNLYQVPHALNCWATLVKGFSPPALLLYNSSPNYLLQPIRSLSEFGYFHCLGQCQQMQFMSVFCMYRQEETHPSFASCMCTTTGISTSVQEILK